MLQQSVLRQSTLIYVWKLSTTLQLRKVVWYISMVLRVKHGITIRMVTHTLQSLVKRLMPMVRQRWRSIRDHSRMEVSRLHSLHGLTMQRTLIQTVKHTTVITGNLMFRLLSIRFSRIGSTRQDVRTLTSTWKRVQTM